MTWKISVFIRYITDEYLQIHFDVNEQWQRQYTYNRTLNSCCTDYVAMDLSSVLLLCSNIRLCQIQIPSHCGLRRVRTDYLQSQGSKELTVGALSAVISVNMLKGRYKASSGIPQVENAKFSLSGRYKYFLCVYCPLCRGCNMYWVVFFTVCFVLLVKEILCSCSCLVMLCWQDEKLVCM